MKYVGRVGWLVVEEDAILGELFEKYKIGGFGGDMIIYRGDVDGAKAIVLHAKHEENSIEGANDNIKIRIVFSPKKKFAMVEVSGAKKERCLMWVEGLSVEVESVPENILKDTGWTVFVEDIYERFDQSVKIKVSKNAVEVVIRNEGIPVNCTYSWDKHGWLCRATDVWFDWGSINAEIIPDVDSLEEFFDIFS